jgi:predicted secreted protein
VDARTELVLQVGERRSWTLPVHGGGGYRWSFELTGDVTAVDATVLYAGDEMATAIPGSSRAQVVTVEGLARGAASVVLVERRSWEDDSRAIAKQVVDVTVVSAEDKADNRLGRRR